MRLSNFFFVAQAPDTINIHRCPPLALLVGVLIFQCSPQVGLLSLPDPEHPGRFLWASCGAGACGLAFEARGSEWQRPELHGAVWSHTPC